MVNKLKILMAVSLGLNLLLAGAAIGFFAKGCRQPPPFPPPSLQGKISPEHEKLFAETMRGLHEKSRDTARQIDETRREVLNILTAPQFDAAAYRKKSAELHEWHGKMKSQLTETVVELAAQLSPEERRALAGFLEKGPPGQGPRPPHGGPPPHQGPPQHQGPPPPPPEGPPSGGPPGPPPL